MNNVIHVDLPTWYCMRQCKESINHLTSLRDDKYLVEINGEKELYRSFMKDIFKRAA